MGGELHAPAALPREISGTHCIGGWVGPRAGLGGYEKLHLPPGFDPRTVKLYRLSYCGSISRVQEVI